MVKLEPPSRLSQISTNWSELLVATEGPTDENAEAQRLLLQRYAAAVYRYLLGAVKDHHVADDLAQEFAMRFLRGDFRNVDPSRGRFRDFLKRALSNLVTDHFRRRRAEAVTLSKNTRGETPSDGLDRAFDEDWRREILSRTWQALQQSHSERTNYYLVLRTRAEEPELNSTQLAERISEQLGKTVSPAWVRQTLLRARRQFNSLMRREVGKTLRDSGDDRIDEELADLGLLEYYRA